MLQTFCPVNCLLSYACYADCFPSLTLSSFSDSSRKSPTWANLSLWKTSSLQTDLKLFTLLRDIWGAGFYESYLICLYYHICIVTDSGLFYMVAVWWGLTLSAMQSRFFSLPVINSVVLPAELFWLVLKCPLSERKELSLSKQLRARTVQYFEFMNCLVQWRNENCHYYIGYVCLH